jgi:hypothetical protein
MMTKPVRYQKGQLYRDHGAWFVRYASAFGREMDRSNCSGRASVWEAWRGILRSPTLSCCEQCSCRRLMQGFPARNRA